MGINEHGENISKKLTWLVKSGHGRHIIITDKHNNHVMNFPILFFVIAALFLPLVVGVGIFIFLLSEYHAIVE